MSDEAKKRILARRAKFVAAAIAGMGVNAAACSEPCLSPGVPPDTGADTAPQPCLFYVDGGDTSFVEDTKSDADASSKDANDAADASDSADDTDTGPAPCLVPPPSPDGG